MYDVNRKRVVKRFVEMARISSPSWKEAEITDYVAGLLKSLKVKYRKEKCGESFNLIAVMEGDKSRIPLLFSCHLDTVTPCEGIKPVVLDDRIKSDGTTILGADDKAAIAAFIEAITIIKEKGLPHGPLEFLFSCAEETGLNGIKGFDMSGIRARYAFVFDSEGRIGRVILKAPYDITVNISITGRAAHAGIEPEKGVSAIRAASEIISRIPHGRIDDETTVNVGKIAGGQATNIVAEKTDFSLEVRSIQHKKLKAIVAAIEKITGEVTKAHKAKAVIDKNLEYSGFTIKRDERVIKILDKAIRRIGLIPAYEVSGGGSDTNVLNRAGVKAVNLSTGMRKVHTRDEYILIDDLANAAELVLSIIETF